MRKILLIAFSIMLVLALVAPSAALAATTSSGTSVNVATGGGSIPAVKCKWEQQNTAGLEDGDVPHAVPGFQILPPLTFDTNKTIYYYAVVTDEEDQGNLAQVFADVYHPTGSPEPYGAAETGGVTNKPYFKYEVPYSKLGHSAAQIALVQKAYDAGLITFGAYTLEDVMYELDKGTADLWRGQADIYYEQPAGNYTVDVYGVDHNDNLSANLTNLFTYIGICGVEVDFTSISFGSTNLGVEKMIPGDIPWNDPAGVNKATVRNIGNVWAHVTVMFDDMGFGKDVTGLWNVNYDARMGSNNAYYVGPIMPDVTTTLPNALALSSQDELDLSIKILKGFGPHSGVITIGCVTEPFADPVPAIIVGTSSH